MKFIGFNHGGSMREDLREHGANRTAPSFYVVDSRVPSPIIIYNRVDHTSVLLYVSQKRG